MRKEDVGKVQKEVEKETRLLRRKGVNQERKSEETGKEGNMEEKEKTGKDGR